MSTLYLLFFLLVISYVGGFLVGGRRVRGRGLPAGSEWVLVGFVVGPSVLGVLSAQDIEALSPLATVVTGWVGFLAGITFGTRGGRPISVARLALGLASGLLCGVGVALGVWLTLQNVPVAAAAFPSSRERWLVSLGAGAVLAGTARQALAWAVGRLGARGPVTDLLGDLAEAQQAVPILATGIIVGGDTSRGLPALPGAALGIGAVLGLLAALLLGREERALWLWVVLFGISVFASGVAEQLDIAPITTLFAVGLCAALASPLRARIRQLLSEVEGAVLLPLLFVAGALVSLGNGSALWVLGAAVVARWLVNGLLGFLVQAMAPGARGAGPAVGLALSSAGPLHVTVGLAFQQRYPGPVGSAVLATAAAAAVASEFVGPPALRRALRRAGEVPEAPPNGREGAAAAP